MKHPRPSCPAKRCPEHHDERETLLDEATPAFLRRLADEIERQQEETEEQRRLTGNRGTDAEKRKILTAILLFHGLMGGGTSDCVWFRPACSLFLDGCDDLFLFLSK